MDSLGYAVAIVEMSVCLPLVVRADGSALPEVVRFGESLRDTILYPVPHRQYVFTIPVMLRVCFKYDRGLLTRLCHCAYESLLIFLRNTIGLTDGVPGVVMSIHSFGDYPEKFHPHIHAIASDGLFAKTGTFCVMPGVDLKPLEETCPPSLSLRQGGRVFRASVFKMLKEEGKIGDDLVNRLMGWRHSGFSVHNGVRVRRDDDGGREALAQYIIRNTFSVEKLKYIKETATVIYRSKMTHGNTNKKNFQVYTPEEFIAAITQHIPEKSFQMVRYYGWYSSKSRGIRKKQGTERSAHEPEADKDIEIIDVSEYQPPRIPSKDWRECIKKVYEADPLCCPRCGGQMKIISFITDPQLIRHILEHLNLWVQRPSRDPPSRETSRENGRIVYEPFDGLSACGTHRQVVGPAMKSHLLW